MSIFDNLTVEDFKNQFPRFSPTYLTDVMYSIIKVYFKGDIVYCDDLFYQCTKDNTTTDPSDETSWILYNDSVLNYTQDTDIEEAFEEAKVNFNEDLFSDEKTALKIFLFLVAHYLTVDFQNALGGTSVGITTSKSVGSVSEGYTIPPWINDNPTLSMYATTGYGIKYCSLIKPFLVGNIMLFRGGTTIA